MSESKSSHSDVWNLDENYNEELIDACGYQYAPSQHAPLALSAKNSNDNGVKHSNQS